MLHDQQRRSTSTFDYVVVGTGAAGSIVAARLSEDPGITVCALESGPRDRHPYIHIPAGFIKIIFNEAYTWQFKTEPSPNVNGRSVQPDHPRGESPQRGYCQRRHRQFAAPFATLRRRQWQPA